jgi:dihydrofolate reductase
MAPIFSVFIATSLDGYIAEANGGLKFLDLADPLDETHGYEPFFKSIDTIVVGRGTYDVVLGFPQWPYAQKRVIVMTNRLAEARPGVEFVSGTVADVVARVGDAKRVYVDGGNVIRQFFAAGLIDDMTLTIIPIVLGDGIPLWDGGEGEHRLVLEKHLSWSSGAVQMRYRVHRS